MKEKCFLWDRVTPFPVGMYKNAKGNPAEKNE